MFIHFSFFTLHKFYNMERRVNFCLARCAIAACFIASILGAAYGQGCAIRSFGTNKIVCVCNATYCDNLEAPESLLKSGFYLQYTSTQSGKRLIPNLYGMTNSYDSTANLWKVSPCTQYQEMLGFGGAITDAVGINLGTLSQEARERLLNQYYGPTGIGYTFVRTPMGGSDFSTRFYTYDDGTADDTLSRFSLASEDHKYKLPYLKYIKLLSNPKVITAPWSPPTWMVESRNGTVGFTRLKDQYYQVMAEYFVNSLQAFKNEGIDVWGVSSQNEPGDGYYAYFGINSCGYSPQEELNFIVNNLGPTLKKNGFGDVHIFDSEDQRTVLPDWADTILSNATAYEYLYGTAVHWYFDDQYPASRLTELHNNYPNKPIFYTESSFIPDAGQPAVLFGDWGRAEKLSSDMIEVFNNWVTGWVDWNIALDTTGGPTYLQNYLDSAIIVNATSQEFYKQPFFYSMAHFSKFVTPGSKRIELKATANSGIDNVAFLRPDNIIAVVLLNRNDDNRKIVLQTESGDYMPITVQAHSLNTVLFNNN